MWRNLGPLASSEPPARALSPTVRGILWMLVASTFFALMGAAGKAAAAELPAIEVAFFRSFLSFLLIAACAGAQRWDLRVGDRPRMALRALAGTVSLVAYFWALSVMPLAEALLLAHTSPIFTALFAWWLLGEKPTRRSVAGLVLALVGVALLLRPGTAVFGAGGAVALLGAASAGLAYTQVRTLKEEPTWGIVFWFMLVAWAATLPAMAPTFVMPTHPGIWAALAGAGFTATLAQGAMTRSYRLAPAGTASIASLGTVLVATVIGVVAFGEVPGPATWAGGVLILAGTWVAASR
ncbi:MAG: DMT family transporter [Candidatus Sericytochromatia bacterium]|nr:DMT family transporter [Candidatus Tanganyikabacteria bacterium]